MATTNPLIYDLSRAVARMEGYAPGTRAYRNNNPGNIWDGLTTGKTTRIWPHLPIDDSGFVVYPSLQAGWDALQHDLTVKYNRGMTLASLLTMYAPPNENDTAKYISNVSAWLNIPPNVPLPSLAYSGPQNLGFAFPAPPSGWTGNGTSGPSIPPPPIITLPGQPGPSQPGPGTEPQPGLPYQFPALPDWLTWGNGSQPGTEEYQRWQVGFWTAIGAATAALVAFLLID